MQAHSVWEQTAEQSIWNYKRDSNTGVEKTK